MIYDERTLAGLLKAADETFREQNAFWVSDDAGNEQYISFRKLREETDTLSTGLLSMGLRHSQIAIYGENRYEWLLAFFAIIAGGNVAVPTDKALSADDALRLFRKTDCAAVICSDTYGDKAQAFEEAGLKVIRMSELTSLPCEKNGIKWILEDRPCPQDPAAIYFTSGTTGETKGVVLTQENLIAVAASSSVHTKDVFDHRGNFALLLPLHHTFATMEAIFSLVCGACLYIARNMRNLWAFFSKAQPVMMFSVPMLMENLLRQAVKLGKGYEAFGGKLEIVFCGGAFVSTECVNACHQLGIELLPGYGITECSSTVSSCLGQDRPEHCVGFPLPNVNIAIAEDGEILVRGDTVFSGYYKDPEATVAAFRDGWFLTGDIGYMDEEGRLYVTGRKKNLIILSNGENVSPEELEQKISLFPYVKEVLVYAENSLIVAEVYPDLSVNDIQSHISADIARLNRTLPIYKNIGKIVVRTTEFSKTASMKIKRERTPL